MSSPKHILGRLDSNRFQVEACLNSLERQGAKIDEHIYELLTTEHQLSTADIINNIGDRTALHKKQIHRAFADGFGIPFVDMDWISPNPELLPLLNIDDWKKHQAFPLSKIGGILEIAFANPFNAELSMYFEREHHLKVSRMYAVPEQISEYLSTEALNVKEVQQHFTTISAEEVQHIANLLDQGNLEGIVPLAEQVITLAKKLHASDVHIEALEHEARIRMRVDGALQECLSVSNKICAALSTYFKVKSHLDITEKRLPQDGRMSGQIAQSQVDMRVSTVPTVHGEKICIRLLDQGVTSLSIDSLSFSDRIIRPFKNCINSPHGLFVVTGPTGSGKTTTLYASLSELSDPSVNITTIEDPVEYSLGGINQIQVHPKIDLDFPRVLRSVLRQDPDIILIGEIRDRETAQIAIKAALTGHLVLSTLHTNSAAESILRLIDMGIPAYLVSQALIGTMGQRLVKRLCDHCKRPTQMTERQRHELQFNSETELEFFTAVGCSECKCTGFKGRLPVQELITISPEIRQAISLNKTQSDWITHAHQEGFRPLYYDALIKALCGLTTIDEVLRVKAQ